MDGAVECVLNASTSIGIWLYVKWFPWKISAARRAVAFMPTIPTTLPLNVLPKLLIDNMVSPARRRRSSSGTRRSTRVSDNVSSATTWEFAPRRSATGSSVTISGIKNRAGRTNSSLWRPSLCSPQYQYCHTQHLQ